MKLNSTQGGVARHRRSTSETPARHRLEQGGGEVGDLEAERAHEVLHCTLMYMSVRRRAAAGRRNSGTPSRDAAAADGGLPRVATLQQADEHDGVVGQILADAGQIGTHLDAMLVQMAGGPMPAAHQEGGRMHAARGQDDLAASNCLHLAANACGHAG